MKKSVRLFLCLSMAIVLTTVFPLSCYAEADDSEYQCGLIELHENIPWMQEAPSTDAVKWLPPSVDLSSKCPPVGSQGKLASCVSWCIGYALKTFQEGDEHGWDLTTPDHQFSPAYIFNQTHADDSPSGTGSNFGETFRLMIDQGCTTLADMPYDGAPYGYQKKPTRQQIANAAKYKAKTWYYLRSGDYNQAKQYIAQGRPIILAAPVYPDFRNLNAENPVYDDASGDLLGGHGLCVVGYDDSKKAVKIINSWGTKWGLNGYGYVSYKLIKDLRLQMFVMEDIIDSK